MSSAALAQRVRVMQVIALTLVAGSVVFLGIVVFLQMSGQQPALPEGELPLITIVAGVMTVACLGARFVLPGVIVRNLAGGGAAGGGDRGSEESLAAAYQTSLIMCMALIEGPTYCAIVAYWLEGHVAALVLVVVLIVILLLHFPTAARVANWIKRQQEQLEIDRGRARE